MSGEIYYSDTREILVDFTNSRDYSGLSNLYNSLKSDLTTAGIPYRPNDTYYLLNMPGDVSITMALGLGLGLRSFKSVVSNFQSLINQDSLGMSDVCLFGSCQVSYPDHTSNSKTVTQVDNCYGYDKAHNNQFKQKNPTAITVGYGNNKTETIHIDVGQQCLIDYSKFYNSSKSTGDICGLTPHGSNTRAKKSTYKFTLPRYCYGRVLYNIMAKSNGTWAIYFHQVRPRNAEIPTHLDRSGFHREEYNNFGVTSVMFYDASSKISGWIMPQGPVSPIKNVASTTDYNWSVLYSSTQLLTHPLIGIRRQPVIFNDTTILPDIWTIKTTSGNEIDPDIITRCCIDCRIPVYPGNHFKTKLYAMKSYHATTAECQSYIRRTKNDGTTWEWGGYDMIHRII